jgi:HlyD family secretion protein
VLSVDNAELLLRPGMTATASIHVHELRDALLVPNAALRFSPPEPAAEPSGGLRSLMPRMPAFRAPSAPELRGRQRSVWRLEDGNLVAVPVEVGPSDGRFTQLLAGALREGEAVVVDSEQQGGS